MKTELTPEEIAEAMELVESYDFPLDLSDSDLETLLDVQYDLTTEQMGYVSMVLANSGVGTLDNAIETVKNGTVMTQKEYTEQYLDSFEIPSTIYRYVDLDSLWEGELRHCDHIDLEDGNLLFI